MIWQQLTNGLLLGSVYALVAVAFSLCWGFLNFLNFAIPGLFMVGGFGLWVVTNSGTSWAVAIPVAVCVAGLISCVMERVTYRLQRSADPLIPLVSSLAILILLENVTVAVWGSDGRALVAPWGDANIKTGDLVVGVPHLLGLVLVLVACVGIHWIVNTTKVGRGMRALAESPSTANLLGVSLNRLSSRVFLVAGVFSALAGVVFGAAYLQVSPFIGDQVALKGLCAMVLGGMGSVWGALLGGLLIGVAEVFATQLGSADTVTIVVYGALLAVLLLRPTGLFGRGDLKQEKF